MSEKPKLVLLERVVWQVRLYMVKPVKVELGSAEWWSKWYPIHLSICMSCTTWARHK